MTTSKTAGALFGVNPQNGLANLVQNTKNVSRETETSFADTLSKTSEVKSVEKIEPSVNAPEEKEVVSTESTAKADVKDAKEEKVSTKEAVKSEDKLEKITEEVTDGAKEVFKKLADEFDLSDEELENAMEVLNMTMVDLFDMTKLQTFIMNVTDTEDSVSLLTNVEVYDSMKEVTGFAENILTEISQDNNISLNELNTLVKTDETFKTAVENLLTANEAPVVSNMEVEVADTENTIPAKNVETVAKVDTTEADNDVEVEVNVNVNEAKTVVENSEVVETETPVKEVKKAETKAIEPKEIKLTDEQLKKLTEAEPETVKAPEIKEEVKEPVLKPEVITSEPVRTEVPVKVEVNNNNNSKGDNKINLGGNNETVTVNTQIQQNTTATVETVVETVKSYTTVDAEDIMRQVTDSVRVNITEDVTEMELRLHPASLGTVNMQVNSQNGQVSAHLTVQNEQVKAVLESQLIKLQETFAEQGTKVDSIEVTVANYNLNSSNHDAMQRGEEENRKNGSKRRNINLNGISSFDEFTDEEKLQAEVMDMNGSSVDFTA